MSEIFEIIIVNHSQFPPFPNYTGPLSRIIFPVKNMIIVQFPSLNFSIDSSFKVVSFFNTIPVKFFFVCSTASEISFSRLARNLSSKSRYSKCFKPPVYFPFKNKESKISHAFPLFLNLFKSPVSLMNCSLK